MHPVLLDLPEWKQSQDLLDQLQQREGAWRVERFRKIREHETARAAYEEQARQAILDGKTPPKPPPALPDEVDPLPIFRMRKEELEREQRQLLQRLVPQVEERAARREAELFAAIRDAKVSELEPLAEEFDRLLAAVIFARSSLGHGPESPSARTRQYIEGVGQLVQHALDNRSLLAPRPLKAQPGVPAEPPPDPLENDRVRDAVSGPPASLAGGELIGSPWAPATIRPEQLAASYGPDHPFRQQPARDVTEPRPPEPPEQDDEPPAQVAS